MQTITAARVRECFEYDAQTGQLIWLIGDRAGKAAGCVAKDGYRVVRVDRRVHYAHRLVWLHQTGEMPAHFLDHRDGDRLNNRMGNLREATKAENAQNVRRFRTNKTGFLGVCRRKGRYIAQIQANGTHRVLGYRDTAEEAHQLYLAAKAELHQFQPAPREAA